MKEENICKCGHYRKYHSSNGRCMVQTILTRGKSKQIIHYPTQKHLCSCNKFIADWISEVGK